MRKLSFTTLFVFQLVFSQLAPMSGQNLIRAYCPQTANLTRGHPTDHWYEGTIGLKHVRMFLERDGLQMVGLYYDIADWKPILLAGQWAPNGKVQIRESAAKPDAAPLGSLNLQASSFNNLTGTWNANPENSGAPKSVSLNPTPQPSCTGSGAWKKFVNPKWPLTFSYPAFWHVQMDDPNSPQSDTLILQCPDPMSMAYGMTLNFSKEQVVRDAVADFTRINGGSWLYGCDSDQQSCKTPTITRRPGITVYHAAEIEFRTYCLDGGYVGQGEGNRFLLSLKDTWIQFYGTGSPSQLMDRIEASLTNTN